MSRSLYIDNPATSLEICGVPVPGSFFIDSESRVDENLVTGEMRCKFTNHIPFVLKNIVILMGQGRSLTLKNFLVTGVQISGRLLPEYDDANARFSWWDCKTTGEQLPSPDAVVCSEGSN